MIATEKLIVCVSPTGNMQGKEANPNIPLQPIEIAEDVYRCWNEGAAIVHIHVRDKNGIQSNDPEIFKEVDRLIRAKRCDIVIQHSTAPAFVGGATAEDGCKSIDVDPEMASLNMGVGVASFGGHDSLVMWTRAFHEKWAKAMLDKEIKPEMEVYNSGHIENVHNLIDKGLLKKPYWMSFVMGMHSTNQTAVRYTPKNIMNYADILPPDSMFSVIGIARSELPATTLSILLGGHVRVGLEDNIYYSKGVLAKNVDLVSRAVRTGRELGREPASPSEVREILGLRAFKG
jgi:3-keto-5-aminohexanoate cleavage enzyme